MFDIEWSVRHALDGDPHDVTGHDPEAGHQMLAVLEAKAHLDLLVLQGRLRVSKDDGTARYHR